MILYGSDKKMLAIDKEVIDFLGFASIEDIKERVEDLADFFLNRPGYIYNFKNFSWIDFVINNSSKKNIAIIKIEDNEIEAELKISILESIKDNSKYYIVNIIPISTHSSKVYTRDIPLNKEDNEEGIKEELHLDFDKSSLEEENIFEKDLIEESTPFKEPLIEEDKSPIDIDFETLIKDEEPIFEEKTAEKKLYDIEKVAKELGLDKSLINDLIKEFIDQAYELKPQIYSSLENQDAELTHSLIHKIKGAAANLRVEEANEILSKTTGEDNIEKLKEIIDKFYIFLEKLKNSLFPKDENLPSFEKVAKKEESSEEIEPLDIDFDNLIKEESIIKDQFLPYKIEEASKELGLDENIIKDFVNEYINQALNYKNSFLQLLNEKDFEKLNDLCHKLKGSAINLRIEYLVNILDDIKKIIKEEDIEKIEQLIEKFYKYIETLKKDINPNTEKVDIKIDITDNDINKYASIIGIDKEAYKELLNEYIKMIDEYIEENSLKENIEKLISLAENLRIEELVNVLKDIKTDNSSIKTLKDLIKNLKA